MKDLYMKKIITLSLFLIFVQNFTSFSQTIPRVKITGKITDADTKKPIENVDVFLSFTTRGDITDRNGIYTIERVPVGKYNLVVSMIGYEIEKIDIELTKGSKNEFNFRLKQKAIEAPEIEVHAAKADEWKKMYKKFERIFLGASGNSSKCKILNPEYIDLSYPRNSRTLLASSNVPVEIENSSLGYHIAFNLLDFQSDNYFDTKFMVTAKFSPLDPKNEKEQKKWDKNRQRAYKGSMRHFFASLAAGTLQEEEFEIYEASNISQSSQITYYKKLQINETVTQGKTDYEKILAFDKYLKIIYNGEYEPIEYTHYVQSMKSYQISWIELADDFVTFNTSGHLYEPYSVLSYGFWGWERAAELLPLDYNPK